MAKFSATILGGLGGWDTEEHLHVVRGDGVRRRRSSVRERPVVETFQRDTNDCGKKGMQMAGGTIWMAILGGKTPDCLCGKKSSKTREYSYPYFFYKAGQGKMECGTSNNRESSRTPARVR